MAIIRNVQTGEVVFESDDPAAIKEHADALDLERREGLADDEPAPVLYGIEGFDVGELETGEVRDDAPHDIPEPPPDDVREVTPLAKEVAAAAE